MNQSNQSLPLYKLIILEMLNSVSFPLTNSQITEFMVKNNYASYFDVQQTFADLTASSLLKEENVHHSTRYFITDEGEQTLSYYKHLIPDSFIETIRAYLTEHKIELRNTVSVVTGYTPSSNGDYAVQCKIMDKELPIFDMMLLVPSEDIAEQMCFNWEKKQAELYSHIMEQLIEEPSDTDSSL